MWKINQVKNKGRKTLKKNIWTLLAIGILMTTAFGKNIINIDGFTNLQIIYEYVSHKNSEKDNSNQFIAQSDKDVMINEYLEKIVSQIFTGNKNYLTILIKEYNEKHNVTKGVVFTIFDTLTKGNIQIQNVFNSIVTYSNREMSASIMLIAAAVCGLLIEIFISYPIQVGEARIYLESLNYPKTKFRRIIYAFKNGRFLKSTKTIFLMELYKFLWNLTIIGGFIKNYSYRMVKFIVAENPKINSKDAIDISRKMMDGSKWQAFKLDLSYVGWIILQYVTFGIAGLYVTPYYYATYAELYNSLRKEYIENKKYKFELLNDEKLFEENKLDTYPDLYEKERKKIKIDYDKKYEVTSIILFFFIFSFVGWIWEVGLFLFTKGSLINRGALYGPWLPIYGTGCTLIVLLTKFKSFRKALKNPILTFFIVMILCTIIEYFTSWYIEMKTGVRYWEYEGIFLNIKGRVCFENSVFFGLGGCVCVYIVAPFLEEKLQKINFLVKAILCVILVTLIGIDTIYSQIYPHMGEGITSEISNNYFFDVTRKTASTK